MTEQASGGFIRALARYRRLRFAWVIAVQGATGVFQALGILLLVPLLGAVGVSSGSQIARWTRAIFGSLGLRPTLTTVLAVYVVVTAITGVLYAYQSVISARYRLEFVDDVRSRLYGAVARAEWSHVMGVRQADVLTILTTNVVWVDQAVQALMGIAAVSFLVATQVAVALRISPTFTGLAVLSGIGLIGVVWPLVRRSKTLGGQLVERNRIVTRLATGFLDALKLAKAYGREEAHVEQFEQAIGSARRAKVAFVRASGIATGLQLALTAMLLAVTVDVGIRVLHVPIGSMLVIAYAFTRVIGQLTASQSNIQQVAQGLAAFDEAVTLIESCEAAQELATAQRTPRKQVAIGSGIALEDVHFTYPQRAAGRVEALAGVSFELPVGGTVALAGPSGAGKTTVADLVAGLLRPSAGLVTVGGEPLTRDRVHGWRDAIALVPQDPFLFHETIAENLRWACPDASEREIWDALALAAAAEFVELLPSGLDTVVGDRGMQLSGGERQRLALARALLRRPQLLILDEATSSLDNENERAIRTALASLRGKMTMLVIAHRLSTASEADEIVVLDQGRVIETGSWSELTHDPLGRLQALIEAGGRAAVG